MMSISGYSWCVSSPNEAKLLQMSKPGEAAPTEGRIYERGDSVNPLQVQEKKTPTHKAAEGWFLIRCPGRLLSVALT